jgi:TolB-like protein
MSAVEGGIKRACHPKRATAFDLVLRCTNLSNDLEQEYFADEITVDLTTDLSRIWQT